MPTYEYYCSKCNREFELSQPMSDTAITTCPKDRCQMKTWGKGKVKRVIGAGAGLIFKGSGFYITDYRSEGYKEAAKKDAAPSGSDKKAEGKSGSDSPAKKSDTTKAAPASDKSKK